MLVPEQLRETNSSLFEEEIAQAIAGRQAGLLRQSRIAFTSDYVLEQALPFTVDLVYQILYCLYCAFCTVHQTTIINLLYLILVQSFILTTLLIMCIHCCSNVVMATNCTVINLCFTTP